MRKSKYQAVLLFLNFILVACNINLTSQAQTGKTEWPTREGNPPKTSEAPKNTNIAHRQLNQNNNNPFWNNIVVEVQSWPHIIKKHSGVSVEGAVGFYIDPKYASKDNLKFMRATEFGHLHPIRDGSMHVIVPSQVKEELLKAKWAELHPRDKNLIMLYAPRTKDEYKLVINVLKIAYKNSLKTEKIKF